MEPAWFLAGFTDAVQASTEATGEEGGPPAPDDGTPPNVIIAVSLDELDGMTGDMLV